MADRDLRELGRRAAAGDVAARAILLKERVRRGELTRERLSLAAHLGDPAAQATGVEQPLPPGQARDPAPGWAWVARLEAWGPEVLARAALAAASAVLPLYEREAPEDDRPRRVLLASQELLACACGPHRAALEAALPGCEEASNRARTKAASDAAAAAEWAGWASRAAAGQALLGVPGRSAAQWAALTAADALAALRDGATLLDTGEGDRRIVREAIGEALLRWALDGPTSC